MNWLPNSIRWRIQLWHGLLLLAVLAAFGVTAYQLQLANELRQLDSDLRLKLYVIHDALARGPEDAGPEDRAAEMDVFTNELFGLPFPAVPGTAGTLQLHQRPAIRQEFGGDAYFMLWRRDGSLMEQSANAPAALTTTLGAIPARVESAQFRTRDGCREVYEFTPPGECILVGMSEAPLHAAMAHFTWQVVAYGALVLALGLLGGWWMASRAIAPIQAISSAAMRIASGKLDERIATAEAESELGQLSSVLNDTFARLAASIEEQKRFTSDAAHELRTPVAVILAQTQLALSKARDGESDQKTIEMTRRSAERMQTLIESLLTLAKADAAAAQDREPLELDSLSRDNVELIRPLAAEKGIHIREELAPAACQAQSEHVNQILTNLLSNAVKYCRPGDEVSVCTHRQNGHAVLTVADTGPGIASEHLPHLFERFYRADASRNRSTGGAGLGLAICKTLVEAHGGEIRVESELQRGTRFVVHLPAA